MSGIDDLNLEASQMATEVLEEIDSLSLKIDSLAAKIDDLKLKLSSLPKQDNKPIYDLIDIVTCGQQAILDQFKPKEKQKKEWIFKSVRNSYGDIDYVKAIEN